VFFVFLLKKCFDVMQRWNVFWVLCWKLFVNALIILVERKKEKSGLANSPVVFNITLLHVEPHLLKENTKILI
jgi:hypothetical protein